MLGVGGSFGFEFLQNDDKTIKNEKSKHIIRSKNQFTKNNFKNNKSEVVVGILPLKKIKQLLPDQDISSAILLSQRKNLAKNVYIFRFLGEKQVNIHAI